MSATLTIEDGTGAPDSGANSFSTLAEADTYMACRGRSSWADLDDAARIVHLINSMYSMEATFRSLWKGRRRLSQVTSTRRDTTTGEVFIVSETPNNPLTQPLSWPRRDVTDEDGVPLDPTRIPELVKTLQNEIAWHLSQGSTIVPDTVEANSRRIKREKIGPLETEYFEAGSLPETDFPFIYQLAAPLTGGAGGTRINVVVGLSADELDDIQRNKEYDSGVYDPWRYFRV